MNLYDKDSKYLGKIKTEKWISCMKTDDRNSKRLYLFQSL